MTKRSHTQISHQYTDTQSSDWGSKKKKKQTAVLSLCTKWLYGWLDCVLHVCCVSSLYTCACVVSDLVIPNYSRPGQLLQFLAHNQLLILQTARRVARDLHTIAPRPLECTCWRKFAAQQGDCIKSQTANCAFECDHYFCCCCCFLIAKHPNNMCGAMCGVMVGTSAFLAWHQF